MSDSSDDIEDIKARGTDRFQKQQRATKIGDLKISKRLDKALNHTKQQNLDARKAAVEYDLAEGLTEKHQALTLKETIQQELQRDFELNGSYDVSSDDSSSYYTSGSEEGSEEYLSNSDDYRPYSQELSDSESPDNESDCTESSLDNSVDIEDAISKLSQLAVHDLEDEKDIRKSKSHKNHVAHQKDKHDNAEKKVLTFAFSGLHKHGGHHSRTIYNIGRYQKHTLAAYQEELNPTEIAEQPKERARDIRTGKQFGKPKK